VPFAELSGQEMAMSYLRRSVHRGRLAHALLFTGPEGVGKRTAARALAQALNCPDVKEGEACGVCLSCRKIAAGAHPDVRLITAEEQHLKIEQIREQLQQDAVLLPLEGRSKVYILDPAEALTPGAANSLLKVLEEPPAAVTLVLITSQPFALLDTIRSRCQEVRFRPLTADRLAEWLQTRLSCPPDTAHALARLAAGRPAEALRWSESEQQELRRDVLALARETGGQRWPDLARRAWEHAAELPELLGLLLGWYRDLLLLATGSDPRLMINIDQQKELSAAVAGESVEGLQKKCAAILAAADQLSRNVNAQLLLEVMFMNLKDVPCSTFHVPS
jgi:DNA polymerase III subunit delta'